MRLPDRSPAEVAPTVVPGSMSRLSPPSRLARWGDSMREVGFGMLAGSCVAFVLVLGTRAIVGPDQPAPPEPLPKPTTTATAGAQRSP